MSSPLEFEGDYIAKYGKSFKRLVLSVLFRSKIRQDAIKNVVNQVIDNYITAFTHKTINEQVNYEYAELCGDVIVNASIVWYLGRRFPQIMRPEGVDITSRLKANLVSEDSLSAIAEKLGFWPYISASNEARYRFKKQLLCDVLESFIGTTVRAFDELIAEGVGYALCYEVIKSLFDEVPISLEYEDIVDSVSRLKETLEYMNSQYKVSFENAPQRYFGTAPDYEVTRDAEQGFHTVKVRIQNVYQNESLGEGRAPLLKNARKYAARQALKKLKEIGFTKPVPDFWEKFC